MNLFEDHEFDSAGVPIRFIDVGQGEPVVLVHSYTSDVERQWISSGVVRGLCDAYRVIALDMRGHGKSGKPHDPQSYGAEMAWDIVRLLDHLAMARAHIIGYSMGAHVVAQLLTLAAHRFTSAVLGGATGRRSWDAARETQAEIEAREMEQGMLTSQSLRLSPVYRVPATISQVQERSVPFVEGQDYLALAAIRRSNKWQVIATQQLAALTVPVLGIVGSADPYLSSFTELKQAMPTLRLVIVDGATHESVPGTPEFIHAVRGFLAAHVAAR